ncbi:MAG: hypothetical protein U0Z17_06960 [Bacteroidales bacterium]
MVSNIRIAVGAPDMRNKLMTEGKLVTYGIYFDVNKDVVKPESNVNPERNSQNSERSTRCKGKNCRAYR